MTPQWIRQFCHQLRKFPKELQSNHMIVLTTLFIENRPSDFTECSRLAGLRKPAVSRSLEHLARFCLVSNRMNGTDRRRRMLSITAEGAALIHQLCGDA